MLTHEQLIKATLEHFEAEARLDVDWVCDTVTERAEYEVVAPFYADDPLRKGVSTEGREAVRALWQGALQRFARYEIQCGKEDLLIFPERNTVFAQVCISVTPMEDFEGFPAGKAISYKVGALCLFDDHGKLTRETVYGSMPTVLLGLRRMRDYISADATA